MSDMKNFRIKSKRLLLTYSKANVSHELILKLLEELNLHISTYVISKEKHSSEDSHHIHVLLILAKELETRNCHYFDLTYEEKVYHPNIRTLKQKISDVENAYNYVTKEDKNYISNISDFAELWDSKEKKETVLNKKLLELTKLEGTSSALKYLSENYPEKVATNFAYYKKNLQEFERMEKVELFESFNFTSFILTEGLKVQLDHWLRIGKSEKVLTLHGPSGTGKTELAKAIIKYLGLEVLIVSEIQGLKLLNDKHNAILYDDMRWLEIPREVKIALLDIKTPRDISIKHGSARLKAGLVKIVTTNILSSIRVHGEQGIERRLEKMEIKNPLYKGGALSSDVNETIDTEKFWD